MYLPPSPGNAVLIRTQPMKMHCLTPIRPTAHRAVYLGIGLAIAVMFSGLGRIRFSVLRSTPASPFTPPPIGSYPSLSLIASFSYPTPPDTPHHLSHTLSHHIRPNVRRRQREAAWRRAGAPFGDAGGVARPPVAVAYGQPVSGAVEMALVGVPISQGSVTPQGSVPVAQAVVASPVPVAAQVAASPVPMAQVAVGAMPAAQAGQMPVAQAAVPTVGSRVAP